VLVVVLAQPLVSLAFQRGAFEADAASLLASVVAVYALQFPFDALNRVYVSYWYARFDTVVPFVNVALGVGLDILFAVLLFIPLGIHGIALGYVLSSVGYLIHGAWSVHHRTDLPGRPLIRTLVRVALAATGTGIAAWLVLAAIPDEPELLDRLIRLGAPGTAGVVVLVLMLAAFRFRIWGLLRSGGAPG
jgi:putative peptidoglycan lipid II flippase